jgi:Rieske 2Fe-2S family protein
MRVPLDPRRLALCLEPFPDRARTLPAAAYTSPEVFAWEQEHFFEGSWVCVGRSSAAGEPGDQLALHAGREGILLVRDVTGELRAFSNVCRHRGHELVRGTGPARGKAIRCPYHRWTYGLDGTFIGGPGLASQPGFDKRDPDHSLVQVRAVEWRGWVFVNVSGDAPPFEDHLGSLDDLVADYEPERLFVGASHRYEIAANWKIVVENYHECYHCSEIHPELCTVSSPGSGEDYEPSGLVIGGSMELLPHAETMSLDGISLGVPFRKLSEAARRDVHYVQIFPNVLLSIHPDYVMTHILEPLDAGRTRIDCSWLFPPEAREREAFSPSYAAEFWDITNQEDWAACESVQVGAGRRGYRQSPFSSAEHVVHQSMALVAHGYLEGGAPRPVEHRGTESALA